MSCSKLLVAKNKIPSCLWPDVVEIRSILSINIALQSYPNRWTFSMFLLQIVFLKVSASGGNVKCWMSSNADEAPESWGASICMWFYMFCLIGLLTNYDHNIHVSQLSKWFSDWKISNTLQKLENDSQSCNLIPHVANRQTPKKCVYTRREICVEDLTLSCLFHL